MADKPTLPEDQPVEQPDGADVGEGGVQRQRGPDLPTIHRSEPFADAPVIQADPETTVTRQGGFFIQDAGAGAYRVDAPVDDSALNAPLHTDRHQTKEDGLVQPGNPEEDYHRTTAYGSVNQVQPEVEVTRQGVADYKPPSDVHYTDEALPVDHPTGVVSQDLPDVVLPTEQLEQFRQDKPYKGDRIMSPEEIATQQAQLKEALGGQQLEGSGDDDEVKLGEKPVTPGEAEGEQSKPARQKEDNKGKRKSAEVTDEDDD